MRRDPFQAIADPSRRAILTLLAVKAMTPNAIAEHFDSSRQAVSKHIRVLSECQLLNQEQQGREIVYSLNARELKAIEDWLAPFKKLWETRFEQLDAVLKNIQKK